ncbi:membrane protein [Enterococcus sp. PF1-24]|uniref:YihY/virulence factor BrkB family protein n=1 Tax=unclassified Enterococcus TaxID=2608891 RepID=UPI002474FE45|nr:MULTISPECIES: YihY/virulence factor BrkB family protein [unclassified Enterococcus]MDH6364559.1 membrane protein [Enterococcus sp. PFB1-1]MDH6401660.1 membrane protein [Enterococcus sp. PF1-24]
MIEKWKQRLKLSTFIRVVYKRMTEADIINHAAIVAYYLMLSLFPLLIAVGNILPFLKIEVSTVLVYVQEMMPAEIFDFLKPAIEGLLTQRSGSLLSVSALTVLWSASQSINALQTAMNKAYGVEQRGNIIWVRIVSIFMIVFLLAALGLVTVVLGYGKMILDYLTPILQLPNSWLVTFQTLKWPVTLIGLFVIMMLVYFLVPNAKASFRSIVPGVCFATAGWLLLSQAFSLYSSFFVTTLSGYQIIGSFIVLMLWLNFASVVMILGGVINAVVAEYTTGEKVQERVGMLTRLKELRKAD